MWEYKIINSADAKKSGFLTGLTVEDVERYLNSIGRQGWEIIDLVFSNGPNNARWPYAFSWRGEKTKK